MSHYTVMVVTDGRKPNWEEEVEKALAPYDENIVTEPRVDKTKAQLLDWAREFIAKCKYDAEVAASVSDLPEGEREEAYRKAEPSPHHWYGWATNPSDGGWYSALDPEDEEQLWEAVKRYSGDELTPEGELMTTYNPDSKWDWYSIGGRWSGYLKIRKDAPKHSWADASCDSALAKYVDWDAMLPEKPTPTQLKRAKGFWNDYVEGKATPKEVEERHGFVMYKPEWYKRRFKTPEAYALHQALNTTYAVLDADGWHAPGNMGWFGCSSESDDEAISFELGFRKRFVDKLDPDARVTIVDCHI